MSRRGKFVGGYVDDVVADALKARARREKITLTQALDRALRSYLLFRYPRKVRRGQRRKTQLPETQASILVLLSHVASLHNEIGELAISLGDESASKVQAELIAKIRSRLAKGQAAAEAEDGT